MFLIPVKNFLIANLGLAVFADDDGVVQAVVIKAHLGRGGIGSKYELMVDVLGGSIAPAEHLVLVRAREGDQLLPNTESAGT